MNDLDQFFEKRLQKYESEVPDTVWKKIEKVQHKKRRTILWLWSGVSAAALIMAIFISTDFDKSNSPPLSNLEIENNKIERKIGIKSEDITNTDETPIIKNKKQENNPEKTKKTIESKPNQKKTNLPVVLKNEIKPIEHNRINPLIQVNKIPLLEQEFIYSKKRIQAQLKPSKPKTGFKFSKLKKGLSIELSIGAGIHKQILETKRPAYEEYRNDRDTTENEMISYAVNFRISKRWENGFSIRTGLGYTLINDRFHWEAKPGSASPLTPPGGEPPKPQDTKKTTWNRSHFIDIPILLSYGIKKNRWGVNINTGPMFNILFMQKGDILSPGRQPISITTSSPETYPAFKKDGGISFYSSINLEYRLNKNTEILIEPFYMKQLSDLSSEIYPLRQKNNMGGMTLGLRKIF